MSYFKWTQTFNTGLLNDLDGIYHKAYLSLTCFCFHTKYFRTELFYCRLIKQHALIALNEANLSFLVNITSLSTNCIFVVTGAQKKHIR